MEPAVGFHTGVRAAEDLVPRRSPSRRSSPGSGPSRPASNKGRSFPGFKHPCSAVETPSPSGGPFRGIHRARGRHRARSRSVGDARPIAVHVDGPGARGPVRHNAEAGAEEVREYLVETEPCTPPELLRPAPVCERQNSPHSRSFPRSPLREENGFSPVVQRRRPRSSKRASMSSERQVGFESPMGSRGPFRSPVEPTSRRT